MNALPAWYWGVMGALLGGTIASFLGVVLERVPRGESINGRSKCACGRQLRWHENIPIIGWLRTGGTTPCCRVRLPLSYLLGETLGMSALGTLGTLGGPLGIGVGTVAATALVVALAHLRQEPGARHHTGERGR